MGKSVMFKNPAPRPVTADDWITNRGGTPEVPAPKPPAPAEPMKRLTIDIPETLHTRTKAGCAQRGTKMADLVRELLEREFPAP